ncbi:hypothetical protein WDU94_012327, partial [Cyamophila willieti]
MNKGLFNTSNYCYLNASLQALFHSSLKNVIRDHYCDINMCVMCGMSRTLALTTTSTEPITPVDVMVLLKKIAPTFEHGHQEDSHEFLIQLIEVMDKDKFNYDGTKNSRTMHVPQKLVLQDAEYKLVSCIVHHGHSVKSGHYTCVGYHEGRFYNYDDCKV